MYTFAQGGTTPVKKRLTALFLALTLSLSLYVPAPAAALDGPEGAAERDSGLLWLVNKTHPLPADYVPELQDLSGSVPMRTTASSMRPEAAQAYIAMHEAMTADGVPVCLGQSGYRSYATQRYLVNSRVGLWQSWGYDWQTAYDNVTWFTAPAGTSEHQTGLAMDLSAGGGLTQAFASTPAGKWLQEHAWEYGFILRYQAEKSDYTMIGAEAWHYRYVGVPHAKLMAEKGWCLEEYIGFLRQNGSISAEVDGVQYDIYWTDDPSREFSNVQDFSGDNAGGYIATTARPIDPYRLLRGHWSEETFRRLEASGASLTREVNPEAAISGRDLARLCGLTGGEPFDITREEAAQLLSPWLSGVRPAPLLYADAGDISPEARSAVEAAAGAGLLSNEAGTQFYPQGLLSWANAGVLALRFRALASPGMLLAGWTPAGAVL